jgi:uncharacterized protein YbcV (DUF1398 family)
VIWSRNWSGGTDRVIVDDARIAQILGAVGLSPDGAGGRAEEIIRRMLSDAADEPLALRFGNWRVDMSATIFRSGLTAALMVSAIEAAGITSTAVVVLAAVVPCLVDVDHVAVSQSDRLVFAALKTKLATPQQRRALWDSLPADLQHEITFLEFVDLLARLEQAGVIRALDDQHYGLPSEHGIFRGRIGR